MRWTELVWIERNDLGNWDSGMVKDALRNSHVLYLSTQNSLLKKIFAGRGAFGPCVSALSFAGGRRSVCSITGWRIEGDTGVN